MQLILVVKLSTIDLAKFSFSSKASARSILVVKFSMVDSRSAFVDSVLATWVVAPDLLVDAAYRTTEEEEDD